MRVLNLRCANGHGFEGWFSSDDDYMDQNGSGRIECPLCGDRVIARLPSAPRLNISGARAPSSAPVSTAVAAPAPSARQQLVAGVPAGLPAEEQGEWMQAMRRLLANTEDVGRHFAEVARRIHYGEVQERAIRGEATPAEREALREEGINVMSLPIPRALEEPLQ